MQRQQHYLVTGGAGYPGSRLVLALAANGFTVNAFDVRKPSIEFPDNVKFFEGDITNYDDLLSACKGVDCVFHLASFGMSGRDQLNRKRIEAVNIGGTENVIKACKAEGVTRLVYTSTFNVVYGGQEIKNGDESLPYLPLEKHSDHYSRTKAIAEMKVISANGSSLDNGGDSQQTLRTCALRLAGVYGPGEERHLPRIVNYIQQGLFAFVYGAEDSLVEFLHVDNLVQAHLRAAEALTPHKKFIAAGQAYFISDCRPVNNFEFFRPLVEGLGYTYPKIRLPVSLIYFFAVLTEFIHGIVGHVYNFQPLLTKAEVYKTGVTHYFSIEKAKRELGYQPTKQNDLTDVVDWYLERGYRRDKSPKKSQFFSILLSLLIAAAFTLVLFSWLPTVQ